MKHQQDYENEIVNLKNVIKEMKQVKESGMD
jgi:hypothetical protein